MYTCAYTLFSPPLVPLQHREGCWPGMWPAQAAGPTCQSHPPLSLCYSLSRSLSHTAGHLINPDLLQVLVNGSFMHICSQQQIPDQSRCWTAESLPRALVSINTTAGNQRGQRKTSTHKHMPCTRNYVRAVGVFMHPHTFLEPCV